MAIDRLAVLAACCRATDEDRHPGDRLAALATLTHAIIASSATGMDDAHIALDHVTRAVRAEINLMPAAKEPVGAAPEPGATTMALPANGRTSIGPGGAGG